MDNREPCRKDRHTVVDFLYWNAFLALPLLTACISLAVVSVAGLVAYLLMCAGMLAVLYRFFCTRCPHYAADGGRTRCMFIWGLPGFFQPAPGPYRAWEKALSAAAFIVIFAAPLAWLRLDPGYLALYLLSVALFVATIRRSECNRCVHEHCPGNRGTASAGAPEPSDTGPESR